MKYTIKTFDLGDINGKEQLAYEKLVASLALQHVEFSVKIKWISSTVRRVTVRIADE